MLLDGTMMDRPVEGGVTTELYLIGNAPYGECPIHSGLYLDTSTVPPPTDVLTATEPYPSTLAPLTDPSLPSAVGTTGTLPADPSASPLFRASQAAGTRVALPSSVPPPATPVSPVVSQPSALPKIPPSPSLPSAQPAPPPSSLGTLPKPGVPLPGQAVVRPEGVVIERTARPDGSVIEKIRKPDGTIVTVIRGT